MDVDLANNNCNESRDQSSNQTKRARKKIITKLVASLNRCKVSDRDAVHIIISFWNT